MSTVNYQKHLFKVILFFSEDLLTSCVLSMLQHSALEVIKCLLFCCSVSAEEGMAYDVQKPRHAFVVTGNATQPGM